MPRPKLVVIDGEQRGLRAPYGATKQQALYYQELRDVKNQIFALEQKLTALRARGIR